MEYLFGNYFLEKSHFSCNTVFGVNFANNFWLECTGVFPTGCCSLISGGLKRGVGEGLGKGWGGRWGGVGAGLGRAWLLILEKPRLKNTITVP